MDDSTGQLTELYDLETGTELLSNPNTPIVRLMLAAPTQHSLQSGSFETIEVTDKSTDVEQLFEIKFKKPGFGSCESNSSCDIGTCQEGMCRTEAFDLFLVLRGRVTSPEIYTQLYISNEVPDLIVEWAEVPVLRLLGQLGASNKDDRTFLPGGDGSVTWGDGIHEQTWGLRRYPGNLSMQFIGYFDTDLGICAMAQDAHGTPKQMGYYAHASPEKSVELRVRQLFPHETQTDYGSLSYAVVLYPCHGSWRNAATTYREWALLQPWAAAKTGAKSPPEWINTRHTVLEGSYQPIGDGTPIVPIDGWATLATSWTQTLQTPMMPLARSFERYGVYIMPYFTPLFTQTNIIEAGDIEATWSAVKTHGHRNAAMYAGLVWSIERAQYPEDNATKQESWWWIPEFDGMVEDQNGMVNSWTQPYATSTGSNPSGQQMSAVHLAGDGSLLCNETADCTQNQWQTDECVALTKDGNTVKQCVHVSNPGALWDAYKGRMCPGNTFVRQLHTEHASFLAQNSVDVMEVDQMNGGYVEPCYSSLHGHPRGHGRWSTTRLLEMMESMVAAGREKNPDFVLSLEDPGELWIPFVDIFGCRPNNVYRWPATNSNNPDNNQFPDFSKVVPAFQFVYSAIAPSISWDLRSNTIYNTDTNEHQRDLHLMAKVFVSGTWNVVELDVGQLLTEYKKNPLQPDLLTPTPEKMDAEELLLLKRQLNLAKGFAKDFLMKGSMIDRGPFVVPDLSYDEFFWSPDLVTQTRQRPAVLTSAWAYEDRVGIILVNSFLGNGLVPDDPNTPNINESTGDVTLELPTLYADTDYSLSESVRVSLNSEEPQYMSLDEARNQTLKSLDVVFVEIGVPTPPDPPDLPPETIEGPPETIEGPPEWVEPPDLPPETIEGPPEWVGPQPDFISTDLHGDMGGHEPPTGGNCGCRTSPTSKGWRYGHLILMLLILGLLRQPRVQGTPDPR
jgi:hypothetical protein